MSDSSWAPFGPTGDDDDPPPKREPMPEPVAPPEPEPEPVVFAPPVAPAPAPPAPPVSTWPGPPPAPYGATRRTAGNATASLVLGIVGLVICPLIASAAAIGLGNSAKREIRERPDELTGESLASWGIGLGWLGVAFGIVVILVVIAGAASG